MGRVHEARDEIKKKIKEGYYEFHGRKQFELDVDKMSKDEGIPKILRATLLSESYEFSENDKNLEKVFSTYWILGCFLSSINALYSVKHNKPLYNTFKLSKEDEK